MPSGTDDDFREFCEYMERVEAELDSMPPWQHAKALDYVYTKVGGNLPFRSCGCTGFRLWRGFPGKCQCGHLEEWHEPRARCWFGVVRPADVYVEPRTWRTRKD